MHLNAALIADAAVVERGKLYIHGAGWDTIWAASIPSMHPALALALLFRVDYSEALKDIPISIELVDEDGKPVGVSIQGAINVGHPAGTKPGAPILVPQAITMNMLQLPREGDYSFRISSGPTELGSVLFRVVRMTPAPGMVTQGSPPGL